jgi:hypothetical protein
MFPTHAFTEQSLPLNTGGDHNFDAVSEDHSVVAAILCSRPKTRTGRVNTGGVRKAMEDMRLLNSLEPRVTTLMVFTDAGFQDLVRRRGAGKGIERIQLNIYQLPTDLVKLLD